MTTGQHDIMQRNGSGYLLTCPLSNAPAWASNEHASQGQGPDEGLSNEAHSEQPLTAPGGPKRSTVGRIVAVSLVVCGTALGAAAALNASASGGGAFFLIVVALAALFFVGGFFSWRGKRWAYVLGIVA